MCEPAFSSVFQQKRQPSICGCRITFNDNVFGLLLKSEPTSPCHLFADNKSDTFMYTGELTVKEVMCLDGYCGASAISLISHGVQLNSEKKAKKKRHVFFFHNHLFLYPSEKNYVSVYLVRIHFKYSIKMNSLW